MHKVKLGSALPKSDGNEVDGATIAQFVDARTQGRSIRPRVALLVFDAKDVAIDDEGTETVTLRVRWIQSVLSVEGRRACERMLSEEYNTANGSIVLPFDLESLLKSTFGDLPRTIEQIDEDQERERESMSPLDELKQHLRVVHGLADAGSFAEDEAARHHMADHADGGVAMADGMQHKPEWHGWTRADLEQAQIEAEEYEGLVIDDSSAPIVGDDETEEDHAAQGEIEHTIRQAGAPWAEEEVREVRE